MGETMCAAWNAKYSAFYVTRYSPRSGRTIQVGTAKPTIEAALSAAAKADKRNPKWMTFVDVVKPGGKNG